VKRVVVILAVVAVLALDALLYLYDPDVFVIIACPLTILLPLFALCFRAGLAADRAGWLSTSGERVRQFARFLLPTSNTSAVLAALAGLWLGFLMMTIGAAFTCFDSCPAPDGYFAGLAPSTLALLTPCIVLESLALVTLVAYHTIKREPLRALAPALILTLGDLLGVAALTALYWQGQGSLPVTTDGLLVEDAVTAWGQGWWLAVLVVASGPSAAFAIAQWLLWLRWRPLRAERAQHTV
jgi:hypothetical protein